MATVAEMRQAKADAQATREARKARKAAPPAPPAPPKAVPEWAISVDGFAYDRTTAPSEAFPKGRDVLKAVNRAAGVMVLAYIPAGEADSLNLDAIRAALVGTRKH